MNLNYLNKIGTLTFDMVCKVSTNKIYAGVHWTKRDKDKKAYSWEVMRACRSVNLSKIEEYPVMLSFEFQFKGRVLDSSNCSYMAKLVEDGLVHRGILPDDSYKYVSEVRYRASKGKSDVILLEIWR